MKPLAVAGPRQGPRTGLPRPARRARTSVGDPGGCARLSSIWWATPSSSPSAARLSRRRRAARSPDDERAYCTSPCATPASASRRTSKSHLRGFRAGRQLHHAQIRRHRPGTGHRLAAGGADGRPHWVESELGRGSTFHFTVRLAAGRASIRPNRAGTPRSAACACWSWTTTPRTAASSTKCSSTGDAAHGGRRRRRGPGELRSGRSGEPFPGAGRVMMPGMDGFTLAERIAAAAGTGGAMLIMLSSGDSVGRRARCRELGFAAYLLKPIKQSELLDAIIRGPGRSTAAGRAPSRSSAARHHRHSAAAHPAGGRQPRQPELAVAAAGKRGHTAGIAGNGREALRALATQTLRPGSDGRADAGDGRPGSHRGDPRSERAPASTFRSSP